MKLRYVLVCHNDGIVEVFDSIDEVMQFCGPNHIFGKVCDPDDGCPYQHAFSVPWEYMLYYIPAESKLEARNAYLVWWAESELSHTRRLKECRIRRMTDVVESWEPITLRGIIYAKDGVVVFKSHSGIDVDLSKFISYHFDALVQDVSIVFGE